MLGVVEDVASPGLWDAGHLFVKRRLDLDFGWKFQAIPFTTSLENDAFEIWSNSAYGKNGSAQYICVDLFQRFEIAGLNVGFSGSLDLARREREEASELTAEENNINGFYFLDLCFKLFDYDIHGSSKVNPMHDVESRIVGEQCILPIQRSITQTCDSSKSRRSRIRQTLV